MSRYLGHCHCGDTGFEYRTELDPGDWSVRACQCSYCLPRGAVYTSDPAGSLRFTHRDPARLVRYRFALQTADFLFCGRCGGYLGAVTEDGDGARAVINVKALDPAPAGMAAAQPVSFDGETGASRDSRHTARWTPVADDA